jgi:hypothetical protein
VLSAEGGSAACTVVLELERTMKNTDWGRLAARLLAVDIALWAVSTLCYSLAYTVGRGGALVTIVSASIAPIVLIGLSFLVWHHADVFLPVPSEEGEVGPVAFGTVAVATAMSIAFFQFARLTIEHALSASSEAALYRPTAIVFLADAVLCAVSLYAVVNAKKVCAWLIR